MNSTHNRRAPAAAVVAAALWLLAACALPPGPEDGAAGNLRITVSGGGRTVNGALLSYRFSFQGPGGETITRSLEPPAMSLTLNVAVGEWTIHVDAYTPEGLLYAVGDIVFPVQPDKTNTVAIPMNRLSPLLTTIAEVQAWIAESLTIDPDAASGVTNADPIPLRMGFELNAGNWADLLGVIDDGGKYVALDLSACARGDQSSGGGLYADGTFDPVSTNASTGKGRIVSLVLPGTAAGIKGDNTLSNPTFRHFTAMTSVRGANIVTVGQYAFQGCTALTEMRLPEAVSIEVSAFRDCTLLSTFHLPKVETIGGSLFSEIPVTTLNLPSLTSMGNIIFYGTNSLTTLYLPAVPPPLGLSVFQNTNSGPTLTINVPAGTVGVYETAWGVTADTAAGGNTAVYGSNHKRIVITDTP